MAYQHDQKHEKQGCIQLVRCIPPTDEELKNPQYVPQLEINSQAQQILAERFEAPISIIVYVGNMGVGKSKLATVTVAALEKETPGTDLLWFRSGAGTNGVTQGVWMWSEPLRHPDQDEKTKGSILILDCEGTDNLDENTGANLYFFCMVVSTAFAVVLRPARIDRFQCDRLYHALNRFEVMKSLHVLPNIWLLPLDLPKFLHIDRDTGDDIEISKDEWLHQIFSVDEERNNLSSGHNQRLKEQYEYITRQITPTQKTTTSTIPTTTLIEPQTNIENRTVTIPILMNSTDTDNDKLIKQNSPLKSERICSHEEYELQSPLMSNLVNENDGIDEHEHEHDLPSPSSSSQSSTIPPVQTHTQHHRLPLTGKQKYFSNNLYENYNRNMSMR
ncbi:unnamed protein product [Rotaria sp. Silwood1]|nr:unnamed protein product [Rotaria sp. Silwood1]